MKKIILYFFLSNLFAVNFSEDISPFIYNNCTTCHRSGEISAFLPLNNYTQVYNNRFMIEYVIQTGDEAEHGNPIMPPWPPDRDYSNLVGERYLTDEEVNTFISWVNEGAPQGDSDLEYPIPDFPDGSAIGDPDLVLAMSGSYPIEGIYEDNYRCFIIPVNNEEDIDIAALEFRPGNGEAVHHAIIVAAPHGSADYLDEMDEEPGYECYGGFGVEGITDFLGGYAPGVIPMEWSNGLGLEIPANSDLLVQIHYAPVDEDMEDLSEINVFISDEPIERYVQMYIMANWSFALPPDEITEVYESLFIPADVSILGYFPHCHLLGKTWEVYVVTSLNDTIPFIKIDDWDFDWQNTYIPEKMLHIPSGSTIHAHSVYDNTAENPDNPNNPPEWVFPGLGTENEMFFLPIQFVFYQEGDEDILLGPIPGDVNSDEAVDVLDIVLVVGFILESTENTFAQFQSADINGDYELNVLDIVQIVGIILE